MKILKNKKYLTTQEAALVAGVTAECIRKWCRTYDIGVKIIGRYKVDPERLEKLILGEK